ncbi:MAG TPA: MotA/TolQ/ExbB proton channel family protein [Tepidisphaeraceae bacterium]|jgi:biopolymer transport protein ExbB|nr:MotA/TolQ/ExbB proton channel family protein [Tepidisphaeraceae bacterium]
MRRFSSLRFVLLAGVLAVAVFASQSALAQGAGGAAPEVKVKHKVNPFGIIVQNIDFVFVIIVLCSIIGLTLIIQGFIKARATVMMPEESTNHIRELISQRQFKELIDYTETDPSFVSKALNPALKRAPSFAAMKEAMETAIGEQTADQFRRIEYLNIIGNLGPLLGLLGTVLGMIEAFGQMSASGGQANPSDLAGGISQALCHTMLGLLLALPCLAAFGVLRTIVDRLTVQGALIAEELLLMVKPAEAKPAAAAAIRPGVAPQPAPQVRKAPMPAPPVPNV